MMRKIKKGDEIIVIAGKDKGKRASVTTVVSDTHILVDGINVAKKHVKPNPNQGVAGGIVDKEMPLQVSNVAIYNAKAGKADRVGIRVLEDGRKVRFFKSDNELVDI